MFKITCFGWARVRQASHNTGPSSVAAAYMALSIPRVGTNVCVLDVVRACRTFKTAYQQYYTIYINN